MQFSETCRLYEEETSYCVGKSSSISGFNKMTLEERLRIIREFANLDSEEFSSLQKTGSLSPKMADMLIENVIGTAEIPLGIATNFLINGKDYLIPMAIEEASVVAACSYAAKIARASGGFRASSTDPIMIGQIQVLNLASPEEAGIKVMEKEAELLELANTVSSTLRKRRAGAKKIEVHLADPKDRMLILHILVDVQDAMGANVVNSMCEKIAPDISRLTGGKVSLRIISNLSIHRRSHATATFAKDLIGGEEVVDAIIYEWKFATLDPFRAATHNKGIMNGIDAVLVATMNDWRAVEAGAHAYASFEGYHSLSRYTKNSDGNLVGEIEIPLAVGTVGGATKAVQKVSVLNKILGVADSKELGAVLAAVGLAQNFAAIRALSSEGIQKGHMKLHARTIAISSGATEQEAEIVSSRLLSEGNITPANAQKILDDLRKQSRSGTKKE